MLEQRVALHLLTSVRLEPPGDLRHALLRLALDRLRGERQRIRCLLLRAPPVARIGYTTDPAKTLKNSLLIKTVYCHTRAFDSYIL